jgi:hypothetical protein
MFTSVIVYVRYSCVGAVFVFDLPLPADTVASSSSVSSRSLRLVSEGGVAFDMLAGDGDDYRKLPLSRCARPTWLGS